MNHDKCSVSTGIHEGLTFGQGELDQHGYWEFPCPSCARYKEWRDEVPFNTYWPFTKAKPADPQDVLRQAAELLDRTPIENSARVAEFVRQVADFWEGTR